MIDTTNRISPFDVSPGERVSFSSRRIDGTVRSYLEEAAEGLELGDVFVFTRRPLPRGRLVTLRFSVDPNLAVETRLSATAIVSWNRSWFGASGMQLKIVELEGPRHVVLRRLQRLSAREPQSASLMRRFTALAVAASAWLPSFGRKPAAFHS